MKKKIVLAILVITLLSFIISSLINSYQNIVISGINNFRSQLKQSGGKDGYDTYLESNKKLKKLEGQIDIDLSKPLNDDKYTNNSSFDYISKDEGIITNDFGMISYEVQSPDDGYFNLYMVYQQVVDKQIGNTKYVGKTSEIERIIKINNKIPFKESGKIKLTRIWEDDFDGKKFKKNNANDEIRPKQKEKVRDVKTYISDYNLNITEPYKYFLKKGSNIITIESTREPLIIKELSFKIAPEIKPYTQKLKEWNKKYSIVKDTKIKQEAEFLYEKGSPVLVALADETSAKAYPYNDGNHQKLNIVGVYSWRMPGYWISYEIDAPKEGLYQLTIKGKQNIKPSSFVSRQIKINDEVQYKEASYIPLNYSSDLSNFILGTKKDPYLFLLKKGKNTIEMKVSLGNVGSLIEETKEVMNILNKMYLGIIKITSVNPDFNRDYNLSQTISDLKPRISSSLNKLEKVIQNYVKINDGKQGQVSSLQTLVNQLKRFENNVESLIYELGSFQSNISALGTWVLKEQEQPFTMDSFTFHSPDVKPDRARANIFESLWQNITRFIFSFKGDTSFKGGKGKKKIRVWVTSGRDNVQILRRIIDESFNDDISVDLELVPKDALLRATVSGQGPDVALMVLEGTPIDFAFRTAAYDLTKFSDHKDVLKRFYNSAVEPFKFTNNNHTGVYALPEQQTFPVMFYRTDIFDEYNLKIPKTWDDLYKVIGNLNNNNLDFFVESGSQSLTDLSAGGISNTINSGLYSTLLYQNGGKYYNDYFTKSALDSPEAMNAFKQFTEFFTNYHIPVQANFVNRFRSGEMAAGITDYSTYNTLVVFAPEISDKWKIAEVPGITKDNNTVTSKALSASIMLESAKDKDASWEFLKWWTSAQTQIDYAKEMETIMGAAARYTTANVEALKRLSWPSKDLSVILKMMEKSEGIPQVPGGYMTNRQFTYAFLKVVNDSLNPYETLNEYIKEINKEINRKRKEFKLN